MSGDPATGAAPPGARPAGPGLDWAGMLRAGLTHLRLTPAQFWALTPAELSLMLGLGAAARPMARDRLDELMRRFPDGTRGGQDG
ncbi:rcc01693 family protein [Wenxinia saemankumensis]|uniref:Phage tail assembly chaperone protein, TAC n=1 Tax=Wenxinia saemankumensis TaxID=1447782 RepID=A0A1M6GMQ4_9RHOB|nr:rcc01693 family protein [Wenxinia saemankumensis]SHJ11247.1 phage conserved hypothetical protein [Wenxinia saemankumensis]